MGVFGWFALIERALQAPSVDAVLPTIHFQVHTAFGHTFTLVVGNAVAVFQELWFLEGLDCNFLFKKNTVAHLTTVESEQLNLYVVGSGRQFGIGERALVGVGIRLVRLLGFSLCLFGNQQAEFGHFSIETGITYTYTRIVFPITGLFYVRQRPQFNVKFFRLDGQILTVNGLTICLIGYTDSVFSFAQQFAAVRCGINRL